MVEPLPPFATSLIDAVVRAGFFPADRRPNHVLVRPCGCSPPRAGLHTRRLQHECARGLGEEPLKRGANAGERVRPRRRHRCAQPPAGPSVPLERIMRVGA